MLQIQSLFNWKKIKRIPPSKPNKRLIPNDYFISDKDYKNINNINNIILMNGTAMEKTARTYYKNDEEELRDHLLATLNTHYENASGDVNVNFFL